jgi:hypothetical protein
MAAVISVRCLLAADIKIRERDEGREHVKEKIGVSNSNRAGDVVGNDILLGW